jgi:pyridinium-3,5-biscarboxylic acid mononucleotide synthase
MNERRLREVLGQVESGELSVTDAVERLRILPYEDIDFARIDHHRSLRSGIPEIVYAPGKSLEQLVAISRRILEGAGRLLITRIDRTLYDRLLYEIPTLEYHEAARAAYVDDSSEAKQRGVMVLAGGTADLPVAEEAALTATLLGSEVERLYDVGVAGLHRLFDKIEAIRQANVIVAVAGMEGALPSVVAGLVGVPVLAVPTSVGYGASFGGIAPLLTMLNSCANGVAVVNIDNGFGAGYLAATINRLATPPD